MNKFLYKIFITVLFLAGSGKMLAQTTPEVRVNAVLDSSKIRIGEQVKLDIYLNLKADKNIDVEWPQIGDTLTGNIEVISVTPIDTTFPDRANHTNMLQHQQIIISAYDSGYFAIPGFKFVFNKDTNSTMYTQPLFLEVHTVPTDTSAKKIKDIKPPFDEKFNWKWYINYVYFGVGLLILVGLTIFLTIYLSRRNKKVIVEPEKPKVPPHLTALAALERVKAEQIWKEEKVKEYYSSISDAIRLYIEERFNVNALESTTDEIMTAFRSQVVDKESKDKLQQLLMLSDLVKFAKQFPIESEHMFTLQNAFDFVNVTKREEEVSEEMMAAASAQAASNVANSITTSSTTSAINANSSASSYMPGAYGNTSSPPPVKKAKQEFVPYKPRKENEPKSKVILRRILIVIAAVLSLGIVVFAAGIYNKVVNPKKLALAVYQTNLSCPVMVDADTRLDNAVLVSDDTIEYNYTFVNLSENQIDAEAIKAKLEPIIIEQVKTNPLLFDFRSKNITLQYAYKDKNGAKLFTITVGPKDYSTNS